MTNLELDAVAEGLFKYLQEQSNSPLDAVAILGFALLKIFDTAMAGGKIEDFAEDFKRSLIQSHTTRSHPGTETRQ